MTNYGSKVTYVGTQYLAGLIIVQLQKMHGLHLHIACYECMPLLQTCNQNTYVKLAMTQRSECIHVICQ